MKVPSYAGHKLVTLLAGLSLLASCSKETGVVPADSPKDAPTQAQTAWNDFVQRVSEGVNSDPLGQYVSKATQVADGATRPTRLKMNAEERTWARIQSMLATAHGGENSLIVPEEPVCDDGYYCGGGGGGGVVTPTVTSTFVSSENLSYDGDPTDNPNNYILDLELAKSSYSSVGAQTGYTKLNLDLNKGAGGKYIYLCFSRNRVEDHGYTTSWEGNLGRTMDKFPVRKFEVYGGAGMGWVAGAWWPDYTFLDIIWNPTSGFINSYKQIDLNDGAGGDALYAFLSKNSGEGAPFKEVGIIAGNSSSIQPPAGWKRHNADLNKGAGGDYIYFCYKQ
ncbi:hypothetical protein E5K00_13720 [Hymenobacter aquaticus]|uniref:MABP domain-containing protein n=1 Tax=Hymenobacter aquaticus TaxID=1867101 RepID=A0A4Z0PWR9_9BACT|nr:hypothetical protein [Hymenobacter aquaticus]TGE21343.1 hypothetical protein E5K00_13720 [Hymenobacter aquaticus]